MRARGKSGCLCIFSGMPIICKEVFGISGVVYPSAVEKNQTEEYQLLPREENRSAK